MNGNYIKCFSRIDWTLLPVVLTLQQTAFIIGMSYDWTQKAAHSGKIPSFKIGKRKWFVNRDDLMLIMHTDNIQQESGFFRILR